jgi:hypothetical protein
VTTTCKHGHDHSQEGFFVWIPSEPGRRYHCASSGQACPTPGKVDNWERGTADAPPSDRKRNPKYWKKGALAEAIAAAVPQCELCFGIRRST